MDVGAEVEVEVEVEKFNWIGCFATPTVADHNMSNAISQQCRGFHSTNWMHCKQKKKKGTEPPKTSNLSLTVPRVPVSNGPDSFCSGCGAPWGVQNGVMHP